MPNLLVETLCRSSEPLEALSEAEDRVGIQITVTRQHEPAERRPYAGVLILRTTRTPAVNIIKHSSFGQQTLVMQRASPHTEISIGLQQHLGE